MRLNIKKSVFAILAAGILCLPLMACSEKPKSREFFAMDTYMKVDAWGPGADDAISRAERAVFDMEESFSAVLPGSEVSRINAGEPLALSANLSALLSEAKALSQESGGTFDPTVRPLMEAWGFTGDEYRIPSKEELNALLPLVDFHSLEQKDGRLMLRKGQKIDLGGIAKGWASREVCRILEESGVEHALISLGGSVQVLGSKPDGSLWQVGIQDPSNSGKILGILNAKDISVVTSGSYQRFFEKDGVRYHHIIDPKTGCPARSDLASVTVVCADPVKADAWSTALFVMGRDEALRFWRGHREIELVLVEEDGKITISSGLEGNFRSERPFEVAEP